MKAGWLLCAILSPALAFAAADMYSWTDANGVKHFSDSPPPASVRNAQKISVHGGVTASAEKPTDADANVAATGSGPGMAAAAGYSPEAIQRNCEAARRNRAAAQAHQNDLRQAGPQADAQAIAADQTEIDKAEQQIQLFCGKP